MDNLSGMVKIINSQYYKDQRNKRSEYFNDLSKTLAEYEELKKQYRMFCQTARYYEKKIGIPVGAELVFFADEIAPEYEKEAKKLANMYSNNETEFSDILTEIKKSRKEYNADEVTDVIGLIYVYEEIIEYIDGFMKDGIFDKKETDKQRKNTLHIKNRANHIKRASRTQRRSVLRARKTAPKHKKTGVASLKNAFKRMI